MNDIINVARANRYASASQKKKEIDRVSFSIIAYQVPRFTEAVNVLFKWTEKDLRRDPDNVAAGGMKIVLDALVETGRLPNDSRKYIKMLGNEFPPPNAYEPTVDVTIESA